MRAEARALLLFPLLALVLAASAHASIAIPLELEEVVQRASLVVEGRVTSVTSKTRASEGRLLLETHVTLEVSEVHLGEPLREVRFVLPGGRAGTRKQVVVGTPRFHVGEEVIAFFAERRGELALVGLSQGLYRVNRASDGRAYAVRDLRELALERGGRTIPGERESLPLEDFRAKLRRAIEERR